MRQLLSLATQQLHRPCALCMEYCMIHSTSHLRIGHLSISKRFVECSMRYSVQDDEVAVLPVTKVASCMLAFRRVT